jgi:hypothetical protein
MLGIVKIKDIDKLKVKKIIKLIEKIIHVNNEIS